MSLDAHPHCYTVRTPHGPQYWLDLSGDIPLARAERESSGSVIADRARVFAQNRKKQSLILWPMYIVFDAAAIGCWWVAADRSGGVFGLFGFIALGTVLGALGSFGWSKLGLPPTLEPLPGPVTVTTRGLLVPDAIWTHAPANSTIEEITRWVQSFDGDRGAALALATAYDCVYDNPGHYHPPAPTENPLHRSDWFTRDDIPAVEERYREARVAYDATVRELGIRPIEPIRLRNREDA